MASPAAAAGPGTNADSAGRVRRHRHEPFEPERDRRHTSGFAQRPPMSGRVGPGPRSSGAAGATGAAGHAGATGHKAPRSAGAAETAPRDDRRVPPEAPPPGVEPAPPRATPRPPSRDEIPPTWPTVDCVGGPCGPPGVCVNLDFLFVACAACGGEDQVCCPPYAPNDPFLGTCAPGLVCAANPNFQSDPPLDLVKDVCQVPGSPPPATGGLNHQRLLLTR